MVYSTIFSEGAVEDFRRMLAEQQETGDEFEGMPANAKDATVERRAERMAPAARKVWKKYPWAADPAAYSPRGRSSPRA